MKLSELQYAIKLREENRRLFAYLLKKKNVNPWTRILVEEIIKLNISIIEEIIR